MTSRDGLGATAAPSAHGSVRIALGATMVLVTLAMFPYAADAATSIKYVLTGWGAATAAVLALVAARRSRAADDVAPASDAPARPFLVPVCALLGWLAVASVYADHPANALHHLARFGAWTAIYLIAAQAFHRPEHARRFWAAICVAAAASAAYGIGQTYGVEPFPWAYERSELYYHGPGTFGNPNFAAHAEIMCVVAAIWLASHRGWRWTALLLPVYGWHLYLTGQRGGVVALGVTALVVGTFLIARRIDSAGRRRLARTLFVVLVAAPLLAGSVGLAARALHRTGSPYPYDESLYVRYHGYVGACRMIADAPWLGVGPGNYEIANPPYWTDFEQERFAAERLLNDHVHNDPLEMAVHGGLPAAAAYLAILWTGVLAGFAAAARGATRDQRRFGLMTGAGFLAFGIDGCFGFNIHVPVSGALLFAWVGVFEGVSAGTGLPSSGRIRLRRPLVDAAIAFAAALVLSASFLGECVHTVGRGMRTHGRTAAADAAFGRAQRLAPWNWGYPTDRATLRVAEGQPEAALAHFEAALARHPNHLHALLNGADAALRAAERALDAGEDADEALARADAWSQRAMALCPPLAAGRELRMRVAYGLLLAEDHRAPVGPEAWRDLALEAEAALRSGVPQPALAASILGKAREKTGNFDGAATALARAVREAPDVPAHWGRFMAFAELHGRHAALREAFHYAKRRDPSAETLAVVYAMQADYARRMGDWAGLSDVLNEAAGDTRLPDAQREAFAAQAAAVAETAPGEDGS